VAKPDLTAISPARHGRNDVQHIGFNDAIVVEVEFEEVLVAASSIELALCLLRYYPQCLCNAPPKLF
jgi:hypothetical protein